MTFLAHQYALFRHWWLQNSSQKNVILLLSAMVLPFVLMLLWYWADSNVNFLEAKMIKTNHDFTSMLQKFDKIKGDDTEFVPYPTRLKN